MRVNREEALRRMQVVQDLVNNTINWLQALPKTQQDFEVSWDKTEQLASPATGKLIGEPCFAGPDKDDYARFAAAIVVHGLQLGIKFK